MAISRRSRFLGFLPRAVALTLLAVVPTVDFPARALEPTEPYVTGFSGDGRLVVGFGPAYDAAGDVLVRGNGTVVVVGTQASGTAKSRFAVAQVRPDGAPMKSFGGDGRVTTGFRGGRSAASAVLAGPRGSVLVAGVVDGRLAVARYTRRGVLEKSFGGDGRVVARLPGKTVQVHQVVDTGSGTFTVAGSVGERAALTRLRADGSPDPTYGVGGTLVVAAGLGAPLYEVRVLSDGRILAAGGGGGEYGDAALARYLPDGTPDPTFGAAGRVVVDLSGVDEYSRAEAVVELPDGRLVVGGTMSTGGDYTSFALARLDASGALDSSFGDAGLVSTAIGDYYSRIHDLALQGDGRLVAVGESTGDGPWRFTVARYAFDGEPDHTFSGDGQAVTRFRPTSPGGNATAVTVLGSRVVAVGSADGGFALAAYRATP